MKLMDPRLKMGKCLGWCEAGMSHQILKEWHPLTDQLEGRLKGRLEGRSASGRTLATAWPQLEAGS